MARQWSRKPPRSGACRFESCTFCQIQETWRNGSRSCLLNSQGVKPLAGSSPVVSSISTRGRSSMELEQLTTNEQVGGSSPPVSARLFRCRPIGRTADFGSANIGSNPFAGASVIFDFGLRILDWSKVKSTEIKINLLKYIETQKKIRNPKSDIPNRLSVPQTAIRACFGSKCSQVQILPLRPSSSRRRSPIGRGACFRNKRL